MRSEISGLADKHAFLKLGNNVARFDFSYTDLPATSPAFQPRSVEDDELTFDPFTLRPRGATPVQACIPEETELLADPDPEDEEEQDDEEIAATGTVSSVATPAPAVTVPEAAKRESEPDPVPVGESQAGSVPEAAPAAAAPATSHCPTLFEALAPEPLSPEASPEENAEPEAAADVPPMPGAVVGAEASTYQGTAEL